MLLVLMVLIVLLMDDIPEELLAVVMELSWAYFVDIVSMGKCDKDMESSEDALANDSMC